MKVNKDCEDGIKKGEIGAILMVFEESKGAYEVEFLDSKGYPKAQCTLFPDDLEKI